LIDLTFEKLVWLKKHFYSRINAKICLSKKLKMFFRAKLFKEPKINLIVPEFQKFFLEIGKTFYSSTSCKKPSVVGSHTIEMGGCPYQELHSFVKCDRPQIPHFTNCSSLSSNISDETFTNTC